MTAYRKKKSSCWPCQLMRGLALGGVGALIGTFGSRALGVSESDSVYWGIGLAFAVFFWAERKRPEPEEKNDSL